MTKTPEQMADEWADSDIAPQILQSAGPYKLAEESFLAGYQAAKDQLADADKVMCNTTLEEIKAVDTAELMPMTNLPTPAKWISVKERLPETNELCIVNTEWRGIVPATYGNELWIFDEGQCWSEKPLSYALHWMPLPEAPKGEG